MTIKRFLINGKRILFLFSTVTVMVIVFFFACSKKSGPSPHMGTVPVSVAQVIQKDVPVQIHAIGHVEFYDIGEISDRRSTHPCSFQRRAGCE